MSENKDLTVIRRAHPEDMDELLNLIGDIFENEQGIDRKHNPIDECYFPQWWCLEKDNHIVGGIAAWMEDNGVQLGRFAIHPDYRGKHLGTALIKTVLATLFEQGLNSFAEERGIQRCTSWRNSVQREMEKRSSSSEATSRHSFYIAKITSKHRRQSRAADPVIINKHH